MISKPLTTENRRSDLLHRPIRPWSDCRALIPLRPGLQDLILHRRIAVSGGRGTSIDVLGATSGGADEIVRHLGVELVSRLLRGTRAARLAQLLDRLRCGTSFAGVAASVLVGSSRLGLGLRLGDALAQRLGLGDEFGGCHNNLDLMVHD